MPKFSVPLARLIGLGAIGLGWVALAVCTPTAVAQNHPPATPTITEPSTDGAIVSPGDVHMETAPFADPDPGDTHRCTDWEIWSITPAERAWVSSCIGGVERVHNHLGNGTFENSCAGRNSLFPDTDYLLRVRHRDSSNDPATEWSPWAQRPFRTAPAAAVPPLEMDDISDSDPVRWSAGSGGGGGEDILLPAAPAPPGSPAFIRIESPASAPLLELRASDGLANQRINAPTLSAHAAVRIRISAGSLPVPGLTLPESALEFSDHEGHPHVIYLPSVIVPPGGGGGGQDAIFWVSAGGATYYGDAAQTAPDFTRLARTQALPWALRQPGFRVDIVATGFQLPVKIAFIPSPAPGPDAPFYYVTELFGTIKVVTRSGAVSDYATNLVNFPPSDNFPGSGEQGLTGIAVDPASGDVFAAMLYEVPSGAHYPKVVRFHSTDGGRTASSQSTVLDMVGAAQGESHMVSDLTIGPDGRLCLHMGDGFETAVAQVIDDFRGKILRFNFDGSPAADNPFYNAADGITPRDYVFAYGFRNPFGGAWRASDGFHYEVENGPNTDRFAKIVPGHNYLWDGTEESMHEAAIFNWFHAHAPTALVFVQPETFGGSQFPARRMGHAFVSEAGPTGLDGPQGLGKRIVEFTLDAAGGLVDGPRTLVEYDGTGIATVVALAAGPDGLYFSDFFKDLGAANPAERGSSILRVRYVGEPFIGADVRAGPLPLTVHFSDASTVVGAGAWEWDFGDGSTSTLQNPTHTYTQAGVYDVRLAVTGAGGLLVEHESCFVRAGYAPRVALLGTLPLPPSDQAVVNRLLSRGCAVNVYDAASPTRPTGAQLVETSDAVLLANSAVGASLGQEFRDAPVPVITWNTDSLGLDRIPFCSDSALIGGQAAINIIDVRHTITAGFPGGDTTVFQPPGTMGWGRGVIAPAARPLAWRPNGADGDNAILLADRGTPLLGGHEQPARRAFLFLGSGFTGANSAATLILDRSLDWSAQFEQPAITLHPADAVGTIGLSVAFTAAATGSGPLDFQWRHNGQALADDARISGSHAPTLSISGLQAGDAGVYDAVVSNACASALTNGAALAFASPCPCDWNNSGLLNSQDFFDFLSSFFTPGNNADLNRDGVTNSQDFFDFLACFFAGC